MASTEGDSLFSLLETSLRLSRHLDSLAHTGPNTGQLTPIELLVLQQIGHQPGVSLRELASRVRVQPSNASATVKSLVTRGLVTRTQHPVDRRQATLELTPAALAVLERVHAAWCSALGDTGVASEDLEVARAVLLQLDRALSTEGGPEAP